MKNIKTNKYWFRKRKGLLSKDLGWGYTPISWEGWVSLVVWLLLLFSSMIWSDIIGESAATPNVIKFVVSLIVLLVVFTVFANSKSKK